jgi:hypothetical protein
MVGRPLFAGDDFGRRLLFAIPSDVMASNFSAITV